MAVKQENPLLSNQQSDSGLHVALHPLVLLTISDYITRHTLRQQKGSIIGALLGQQNGREITVEHAFDCKVVGGASPSLDLEWFAERLQQMKDVHKVPALDLVGWYTIVSTSGPEQMHVAIQTQLANLYSESTILLGFHPSAVLEGSLGGKLPLTIYEANVEGPESGGREDVEMIDAQPPLRLTFKELPYTIETGEAEMIGIDFVAKGGGNATAVETVVKKPSGKTDTSTSKGKKKQEAEDEESKEVEPQSFLTREEEELLASLTAKANAIKMLHSRINLITTYLERLPPSYVAGKTTELSTEKDSNHTEINHQILRSIQALLNRLSILVPSDNTAFSQELLAEQNDVNLVSLLSTVTESIKEAREVGRKFSIVVQAHKEKRGPKEGMAEAWNTMDRMGFGNERGMRTIGDAGDLMM